MIFDTTVLVHLNGTSNTNSIKIKKFLETQNIKKAYITRISYIEVLASTKYKLQMKTFLSQFHILEFDRAAAKKSAEICNKYTVHSANHKDLMIASIGMAQKMPIITENVTDFKYTGLKIVGYNMKALKS